MQKFFIITAFALLSSITVSAQTANEQPKPLSDSAQVEFAKRPSVINARSEKSAGRRQNTRVVDGRVVRVGPTSTYLKNGLSLEEVVQLLGKPESVTERSEGGRLLATYIFPRSEGRVLVAQFENGLLTNSRTETLEAMKRERSQR
ncbi:MAG: hypothetical protein ICV60_15590 [Pyrinomonadaceae bacterium]|nr:hypothetical protein [Pyrinomonadaceae bacterium]